jgi:hypothetical protein
MRFTDLLITGNWRPPDQSLNFIRAARLVSRSPNPIPPFTSLQRFKTRRLIARRTHHLSDSISTLDRRKLSNPLCNRRSHLRVILLEIGSTHAEGSSISR